MSVKSFRIVMIRAVKKIRWGERAAIRWLWVGFSVEVTWRQRSE